MRTTFALLFLFYFSQANAYMFPQHSIKAYECDNCSTLAHETLHDRWNIASVPLKHMGSNLQKSYSYNQYTTAKQLEQGVTLPIHAPGAVIRITPLSQSKAISELQLKNATSQFMSLREASSLYKKNETQRSDLLQIKPELGFGNFVLKSPQTVSQTDTPYLINVFDKSSSIYLQIEPSALQYQYGEQFIAHISLQDNDTSYSIENINASLVSPDNQRMPLTLKEVKSNQFQASTILLSEANTHGDNWYIEVDAINDTAKSCSIHRTGHAAFSYSIPSASLLSIKKISTKPLTFAATVEVATASRYALQGILLHNNAKDETVPIEIAQAAQWLEPGQQTINFSFDNSAQFAEDQLAVGYLHLTDYGQLKVVYQYDQPIKLSQLVD